MDLWQVLRNIEVTVTRLNSTVLEPLARPLWKIFSPAYLEKLENHCLKIIFYKSWSNSSRGKLLSKCILLFPPDITSSSILDIYINIDSFNINYFNLYNSICNDYFLYNPILPHILIRNEIFYWQISFCILSDVTWLHHSTAMLKFYLLSKTAFYVFLKQSLVFLLNFAF